MYYLLVYDRFQNFAGWVANSVEYYQMPHSAVSDLGLHCLLNSACPNTWVFAQVCESEHLGVYYITILVGNILS